MDTVQKCQVFSVVGGHSTKVSGVLSVVGGHSTKVSGVPSVVGGHSTKVSGVQCCKWTQYKSVRCSVL